MSCERGDLRVTEHCLGGNGVEAYYVEINGPALAVDPDVHPTRRRMWELVAKALADDRVSARRRELRSGLYPNLHPSGMFFFGPRNERQAGTPDPLAVEALGAMLPEMAPEWILDVMDARQLAGDARVIAAWCELPLEVVLAALEISGQP